MNRLDLIWKMPGAARFLESVVRSLSEHKHAVLVLPDPVLAKHPVHALGQLTRQQGLGEVTQIDVGTLPGDDSLDALLQALQQYHPRGSKFYDFLDWQSPPSRFIAISGMDGGSEALRRHFAGFLTAAGQHAQDNREINFQIVAIVSPRFELPPENLHLVQHSWWGVWRPIDVDTMLDHSIEDFPPQTVSEYYWIRSLCKGLAVADPCLARRFAEGAPRAVEEIRELLAADGSGISLEGEDTFRDSFRLLGTNCPPPPRDRKGRALWAAGHIDWSEGTGVTLGSTIVAAHGPAGILRRLLIGQLVVVFPLVEQVRRLLIEFLERAYGSDWLSRITTGIGIEEQEEVLTNLAPLAHQVFRNHCVASRLLDGIPSRVAWAWREVRNQLAHGRCLSYEELESAIDLLVQFINRARL